VDASQFHYDLPDAAIARHPREPRRAARLLVRQPEGEIHHATFERLPQCLADAQVDGLWANDTQVLHARIMATKPTGGQLEVFLLGPSEGLTEEELVQRGPRLWKAMVRNAKRWSDGIATATGASKTMTIQRREDAADGTAQVTLSWAGLDGMACTLGEVLEDLGRTPLPPYMKRPDLPSDRQDYQTVFAVAPGSVAAPTAGLHYDEVLLSDLAVAGYPLNKVTLHVGAGTFKPLTDGAISAHRMHAERCVFRRDSLERMKSQTRRVATGTTTLRAMESLYWATLIHKNSGVWVDVVPQDAPYSQRSFQAAGWSDLDALSHALEHAPWRNESWSFETQLMVVPGYEVRMVVGLVTNFHQPGSTLLCLVSAFTGQEGWRSMYEEALKEGYRFLSYGDGCLIWASSTP
jgi:S-adenosylmethionine:tRNA ribosyltransferase-isomerase